MLGLWSALPTQLRSWAKPYPEMKPEQLEVAATFIEGRDVFSVLPTGFGKSLSYACLPLVFDKFTELKEGKDGFDMRYGAQGMWGVANYFTVNASYSDSYAHVKACTDEIYLHGESIKWKQWCCYTCNNFVRVTSVLCTETVVG